MTDRPNPGSEEARAKGCTCPVIDNHFGAGFPGGEDGRPLFWINGDCPIHAQKEEQRREEE